MITICVLFQYIENLIKIMSFNNHFTKYTLFLLVMAGCLATGCHQHEIEDNIEWQSDSNQSRAWTSFSKGLEYEQMGAWEEAVQEFQTALSFAPQQPRIYLHLARNLAAMGHSSLAISHLEDAETLSDPQDYMLFFDMGRIYQVLGNFHDAKRMYQMSLDIFPAFLQGKAALASLSLIPILETPVLPPQ